VGLLQALDSCYENKTEQSTEVEYRLLSWGEIYPPFIGNREHSTGARFILTDFPFKLFSVSIPYSELPQKLCLTFMNPLIERQTGSTIIPGDNPDDTAKEFAAFLSLITRRRVFPVGQTRAGGLPSEQPITLYDRSHTQERQQLKEIDPPSVYEMLKHLQRMNRAIAQSFILSMRLYHSAIEIMYTEPEFAYLFLVTSVEAMACAAVHVDDIKPNDTGKGKTELDRYLDSTYPGWRKYCDISTSENRKAVVDMLLKDAYFVRRKFRKFVLENTPQRFWDEDQDDAKPDYLYGLIGAGPDGKGRETILRSDMTIQPLEKINENEFKKKLDNIYSARSKFVHEGARFPESIVVGHFRNLPVAAFGEKLLRLKSDVPKNHKVFLDVPPLLTFERLVSYTLIEFLSKQGRV
jgi:hypothetical protein